MIATGSQDKPHCIFLFGPTASGKTDLAMAIADELPVQLISVDSVQVFRDMDIGSAKLPADRLLRYPHDLIDIRNPDEIFSVADFISEARVCMDAAVTAGKIPLLVGGSMLYFRTLLQGMAEVPESDPAIRAEIEQQARLLGWPAMHAKLAQVDPVAAAEIDPAHSRRISRAMEIWQISGQPMSAILAREPREDRRALTESYRVHSLGLQITDRAQLHDRINRRFQQMLEAGLIDEVKILLDKYPLSAEMPSMMAAGYRQAWQYLHGELDEQGLLEKGQAATRQLAKRQITWMRSWPEWQALEAEKLWLSSSSNRELTQQSLHWLRSQLC